MRPSRYALVAALTISLGSIPALADDQDHKSTRETAVSTDASQQITDEALDLEGVYRHRLARLRRLQQLAKEQGLHDRLEELDRLYERLHAAHDHQLKALRRHLKGKALDRFDKRLDEGRDHKRWVARKAIRKAKAAKNDQKVHPLVSVAPNNDTLTPRDRIHNRTHAAREKARDHKKAARGTVRDHRKAARGTVRDHRKAVREKARDHKQAVREKARDHKHAARERATDHVKDAYDRARDRRKNIRERVHDRDERVRAHVREFEKAAKDRARDHKRAAGRRPGLGRKLRSQKDADADAVRKIGARDADQAFRKLKEEIERDAIASGREPAGGR